MTDDTFFIKIYSAGGVNCAVYAQFCPKRRFSRLRKVVLDLQSELYAKAVRRILVQDLDGYQVDISKKPSETVERCRILQPDVLLMEVTGYTPWMLSERLSIREEVKRHVPSVKIVFLIDDKAEVALVEEIKKTKQDKLIDTFLFTSVSESYLVAVMDSL